MKNIRCSLLIFITGLIACAPQSTMTQTSAPVSSKTPLPSTTPVPTQTLEPIATPIIPAEITLDPCSRIVEVKVSNSVVLEAVIEKEVESSDPIISEFGSPDGTRHMNLALWSEETHQAVPIPLLPDALDPKISTDHRWVLFRRDTSEIQSEFWVVDADSKKAKKLATVNLDEEIKARYPDGLFSLDYGWVPTADIFYYIVDVSYILGEYEAITINERFVLIDANSGKAVYPTNPSEINEFEFSPDGSQMAIQTENEFYVLSTQDGRKQFTIRVSLNNFIYSPDGKYIIDFTEEGILRIDAEDGQQYTIPLKYTIFFSQAEGTFYEPLPDFTWVDDSALLLISLNSDIPFLWKIPFFNNPDPDWMFTIWQVNLENGTTHPIQVFRGDPSTAKISPDNKRLAFQKFEVSDKSKKRDLYLADLASGEILETITDGLFKEWFPDSKKYFYSTGNPYPQPGKGDPGSSTSESVINYYLGKVGENPILMKWDNVQLQPWFDWWWVDENRLVTDCKLVTFP